MKKTRRDTATIFFIVAAMYYGTLSLVSHIPGNTLSSVAPDISDKVLHFFAYSFLGLFLGLAMKRLSGSHRRLAALIITAAVVLLLGALDEFHQSFVPGRQMSAGDVFADFAGGGFGAFVGLYLRPACRANTRSVSPRGS